MLKPPSQNVPGMTDTLEFVKNLWGGMNVPGMGMPGMGAGSLGGGLSTDELDKRITDLKAVESWLNLNLSMLRTSIQAMEVQRGTIAALKSMSDSMTQALSGHAGQGGDQTASLPPFSAFFTASGAPEPGSNTPGAGADPASGPAAGADATMPAAVAWWNLLQEQFRQAVASAMPPDGSATAAAPEAPAAREQPVKEPTDMGARTTRTKADKS
ncbi:hypothetical protein LK540_12355 [Massilia sp. IC2-278]|uniref:PhaM family polyhydroxyalkanoate granule multifunctional regulatory protein n=1 Tax=Massilia sp. IC2-278 TaxID=2887200 RepID=UPI001E2E38FB|nr:PhaM family polyhydroxyalkanoate granule multifunctional regulatory protein [Massilia sp. IC2-278]MCC2961215.1 hypothetical protein [Massilia sp. IC2-278]